MGRPTIPGNLEHDGDHAPPDRDGPLRRRGLHLAPKPPPALAEDAIGGVNIYFNLNPRVGLTFVVSIWERLPDPDADEDDELGDPECILDFRARFGLGRGTWVRGSGTFDDPMFFAPLNRGLGMLGCLRISPRFSESSLVAGPESAE